MLTIIESYISKDKLNLVVKNSDSSLFAAATADFSGWEKAAHDADPESAPSFSISFQLPELCAGSSAIITGDYTFTEIGEYYIEADTTHFVDDASFTITTDGKRNTKIKGQQIRDNTVRKQNINIDSPGQALITDLATSESSGLTINGTGADTGTGSVRISVNTGSGLQISENEVSLKLGEEFSVNAQGELVFTGPLATSKGGTGRDTLTLDTFLVGNGSDAVKLLTADQVRAALNVEDGANNYTHPDNHSVSILSPGTSGQIIRSDGVSTQWWTPDFLSDETDPTVPQYVKDITQSDIDGWDAAYVHSESAHYTEWVLKANTETSGLDILSGTVVDFKGAGSALVTRSGSTITISSTDTIYTHPEDGGGSRADLSGAKVLDGITVNTSGHVTATSIRNLSRADIGLGDVDNTSDADKPISSATQIALDLKEDKDNKNTASGYAGLDSDGKIPLALIPDTARQSTYVVAGETERLDLETTVDLIEGAQAYETSTDDRYIWDGAQWILMNDTSNISVDWANITNKPLHNDLDGRNAVEAHPMSAITGLETALSSKSDEEHTHSALDITSGIFDLSRIPDLPSSKITSGYFSVAQGGTGRSSLTPDTFLVGDDTSKIKLLTSEQVRTALNVEDGANNYTHPSSHPATVITQDDTHRFVTDTQIESWEEAAGWGEHEGLYTPISHASDTDIHITSTERAAWDAKEPAIPQGAENQYFRYDKTWSEIQWSEIAEVPAEFTPEAHDHDVSTLTNSDSLVQGDNSRRSTNYNQKDMDTYLQSGFFRYEGEAPSSPVESNGLGIHIQHPSNDAYSMQLTCPFDSDTLKFRRNVDSTWSDWIALWHSGNFNPDDYALATDLDDYVTLAGTQIIIGNKTFSSDVTLSNGNWLEFDDHREIFPTDKGGFRWNLNNNAAWIYAYQPASDWIDFVFKLTDDTGTTDRFVFWIDDYNGEEYDRYPLILDGDKAVIGVTPYFQAANTETLLRIYHEGFKPTKTDVGLDDVDNTSDADKPISIATQTALDLKEGSLGTPDTDDHVLSSTAEGIRSWVPMYTHPTGDGYEHVPANGDTNANRFLMATDTPGVYQWTSITDSDGDLVDPTLYQYLWDNFYSGDVAEYHVPVADADMWLYSSPIIACGTNVGIGLTKDEISESAHILSLDGSLKLLYGIDFGTKASLSYGKNNIHYEENPLSYSSIWHSVYNYEDAYKSWVYSKISGETTTLETGTGDTDVLESVGKFESNVQYSEYPLLMTMKLPILLEWEADADYDYMVIRDTGYVHKISRAKMISDLGVTPITTQVKVGDGLSGGGDLSSDVTVTLGSPSTITPSSSNSVTTDSHTHLVTGFIPTSHPANVIDQDLATTHSPEFEGLTIAGDISEGELLLSEKYAPLAHTDDTDIHITADERLHWDSKEDPIASGDENQYYSWDKTWKQIQWEEIADKPSKFTPAAHSHDSRYLQLTGGTLAGDLTLNANLNLLSSRSIRTSRTGFILQTTDMTPGFEGGGLHLAGGGFQDDPSIGGIFAGVTSDLGTFTARSTTASGILFSDGDIRFRSKEGLTVGGNGWLGERGRILSTGEWSIGGDTPTTGIALTVEGKLKVDTLDNSTGNILTVSDGVFHQRTPSEILSDIGAAEQAHSHDASDISSGTLALDRIPDLPITKVAGLSDELSDVVTVTGTQTITGAKTFENTLAVSEIGDLKYVHSSTDLTLKRPAPASDTSISNLPMSGIIWHDIIRWTTPDYETSADGATWVSEPVNRDLFSGHENQSFAAVNSNRKGVRWTWNSGIAFSHATWVMIAHSYNFSSPTLRVLVELSTDGVSWETFHDSTELTSTHPIFYRLKSALKDEEWLRITILLESEGSGSISTIRLLTSRWGVQGLGKEIEYPYRWDADKNIGLGVSPTEKLDVDGRVKIRSLADAFGDLLTVSSSGVVQKRSAADMISDMDLDGLYAPLSHVTSTGESHTFIDQDVTSTASPAFNTITTTGGFRQIPDEGGVGLDIAAINKDIDVWRISHSNDFTDQSYGFYLKYYGSGTTNDNTLALWSHNTTSDDIKVYEVYQDASVKFYNSVDIPAISEDGQLLSNRYAPLAHTSDSDIHITAEERTNWSSKEDAIPQGSTGQYYAWDKTWKQIDWNELINTPEVFTPDIHALISHSDWSDYFDQALRTTDDPTFDGLNLTGRINFGAHNKLVYGKWGCLTDPVTSTDKWIKVADLNLESSYSTAMMHVVMRGRLCCSGHTRPQEMFIRIANNSTGSVDPDAITVQLKDLNDRGEAPVKNVKLIQRTDDEDNGHDIELWLQCSGVWIDSFPVEIVYFGSWIIQADRVAEVEEIPTGYIASFGENAYDHIRVRLGIGKKASEALDVEGNGYFSGNVSALAFSEDGSLLSDKYLGINDNAVSAGKLVSPVNINGVAFDGTQDITITSATPNTLSPGTGLEGTGFNGSSATTWDIDPEYTGFINYYTKSDLETSGQATVNWDNLSGVPTSFEPGAHAQTHMSDGSDPLFDQTLNTYSSPTFLRLYMESVGYPVDITDSSHRAILRISNTNIDPEKTDAASGFRVKNFDGTDISTHFEIMGNNANYTGSPNNVIFKNFRADSELVFSTDKARFTGDIEIDGSITSPVTINTTEELLVLNGTSALDSADAWVRMGNGNYDWLIKYLGSTWGEDGNEFRIESAYTGRYLQLDHSGNIEYYDGSSKHSLFHSGNSDFVTISGDQTITGKKTITDEFTINDISDLNFYTSSSVLDTAIDAPSNSNKFFNLPMGGIVWHDVLRWSNPDYETTTDGITWTPESADRRLFSGHANQSRVIIDTDSSTIGARWTWDGVVHNNAVWLMIAHAYSSPNPQMSIFAEASDYETGEWTTLHDSISYGNSKPIFYRLSRPIQDYRKLRLTILHQNGGNICLSSIRLLTSRWGNQGLGKEVEYPYKWDYDKNIGLGTSPTEKLDVDGKIRVRDLERSAGDILTVSSAGVLQRRTTADILSDISAAPFIHDHTESEITDLDKYTQSEVDSLLSGYQPVVEDLTDGSIPYWSDGFTDGPIKTNGTNISLGPEENTVNVPVLISGGASGQNTTLLQLTSNFEDEGTGSTIAFVNSTVDNQTFARGELSVERCGSGHSTFYIRLGDFESTWEMKDFLKINKDYLWYKTHKIYHEGFKPTKADVGLGDVENTALSTWAGSSNITTVGTLASGTVPWSLLSDVPASFTPDTHTLVSHSDWDDYFDQEVKTTSHPEFAGMYITDSVGYEHYGTEIKTCWGMSSAVSHNWIKVADINMSTSSYRDILIKFKIHGISGGWGSRACAEASVKINTGSDGTSFHCIVYFDDYQSGNDSVPFDDINVIKRDELNNAEIWLKTRDSGASLVPISLFYSKNDEVNITVSFLKGNTDNGYTEIPTGYISSHPINSYKRFRHRVGIGKDPHRALDVEGNGAFTGYVSALKFTENGTDLSDKYAVLDHDHNGIYSEAEHSHSLLNNPLMLKAGSAEANTEMLQLKSNFTDSGTATTLAFINSTSTTAYNGRGEIAVRRLDNSKSEMLFRGSNGSEVIEFARFDENGIYETGTLLSDKFAPLIHTSDSDIHITSAERTAWDSKEDAISQGSVNEYFRYDKTWSQIQWEEIADTPTSYTPEAHASSHLRNGSDPIIGENDYGLWSVSSSDPWSTGLTNGGLGIGSITGTYRQMTVFSDGGDGTIALSVNTSNDSGTTWNRAMSLNNKGDLNARGKTKSDKGFQTGEFEMVFEESTRSLDFNIV